MKYLILALLLFCFALLVFFLLSTIFLGFALLLFGRTSKEEKPFEKEWHESEGENRFVIMFWSHDVGCLRNEER